MKMDNLIILGVCLAVVAFLAGLATPYILNVIIGWLPLGDYDPHTGTFR